MATIKLTARVCDAAKAAVVGSLCALLIAPDAMAATVPVVGKTTPLTQDEKNLHALNRMTFGPRPGDEAAVQQMGLEAWFERQLHPESIDDKAFQARLQDFPALQLTIGQMMQRYPSPQMLKQIEKTNASLPADPVEHAIYADSLEFYNTQQKVVAKQAAQNDAAKNEGTMNAATISDGTMNAQKPADDWMQANNAADAKGKRRFNEPSMPADQRQALAALPPQERFQRLVAMSPQEMVSLRRGMRPLQEVALVQGMTSQQKQDVIAMQGGERLIGGEALEGRLLRDVYSQRQLQAVMDDFWLNHFSVYVRKNQNEPYLLASYERDAILPNSLGNFEKLLVATAESPAMLMYLDNWQSIGPDSLAAQRGKRLGQMAPNSKVAQAIPKGINENYARELMELHTLGVGGGYTQKDVIEVAKCFTGWTINRPYGGGAAVGRFGMQVQDEPGEFVFEPNRHEGGSKVVLGHTIKEDGMNEGLEVLHILATSPATAKFISTKLAVRFVSDTPSPALVNAMAATFIKTNGDIKAVLSTMFHSPEFWSPAVYRAKVKTPIEFMVSALRASDASIQNPIVLVQAMATLGMPIYGMQTPNGYSWMADEWVSSNALVSRMNFALVLSGGRVPGATMNWPGVLGEGTDSSVSSSPTAQTEVKLERVILGESAAAHTRATVLANFNDPTVQRQAAENLAKTSETADAAAAQPASADDSSDAQASMKQMRAAYGKKGAGGGPAAQFLTDKAVTPLDTMAGLLMGSPDFQRR